MVRALASYQCGPGLSPGNDAAYGVSLMLVLISASPVFLPPQKPSFLNSNLTWKQWIKSHSVDMPLQIPFNYYLFVEDLCNTDLFLGLS